MFGGLEGVFGEEKKPPNLEVVVFALVFALVGVVEGIFEGEGIGIVGRFLSLPRSGLASRNDIVLADGERLGVPSGVMAGTPTGTGADVPVNHEAIPPFDLSATLMTPSLSPVSVGMNVSTSISRSEFSLIGDEELCFRSGLLESELRKGRRAVSDRW